MNSIMRKPWLDMKNLKKEIIKMSLRKTLTSIVLASAIGLAGCSDTGSIKSYDGKIGDAEVILYNSKKIWESDRLEVTKDNITWIYVDRDENGTIDYAERREGEKVSKISSVSTKIDPFQNDVLSKATESYETMLDAIKIKINSELESQYKIE